LTTPVNKRSRPPLRPGDFFFRVTGEVGEFCKEDRAVWCPVDVVVLAARPATWFSMWKVRLPSFCLVEAERAPDLVEDWRVEHIRLPAVTSVAAGVICSRVDGAWGATPTDVFSALPSSRPRASVNCGSSQSHVAMELLPTSGQWPRLPVAAGGGWWQLPDTSMRGGPKDLLVIFSLVKVFCAFMVVELYSVFYSTVSVFLRVCGLFP
jgi:hypothetical protein